MNPISKTHKHFSGRVRKPRVLENPEEFLGENYESVLNFWLILDDLSEEQWRVVNECFDAFFDENHSEWDESTDLANDASIEVVGWEYVYYAGCAAYAVTNSEAAGYATRELIAMHLILEQKQPLTFFSMFLEVL
jgi:hypothetical protein